MKATVKAMYLIGGTAGRSPHYTDPAECAAEWVRRDDPQTTIRFVLDDGSISHGTHEQAKPVLELVKEYRS